MRALLVLVVLYGVAQAQPKAIEVASTRENVHDHHPPGALGAIGVFGWGGQKDGPSGWVARLDYEVFPFYGPGKNGGFFGFMPAFEFWRSGTDNWGMSTPVAIVGGIHTFPIRLTIGGGVDALLLDQVDDDTGFGLYAPFAMAKFGLDVKGIQMGWDGRIGYRWQFGADDHARWQLGFYVGYTASMAPRSKRSIQ